MQISEFLKLVRFEHAVMLAIAVLIGESIALGNVPQFSLAILLSLLVPVFSEMGSFALNDYLDIESDRINKKMTPLVRGTINPKFAFNFAWFAFAISIILSYLINIQVFIIALIFNALAILYNYKLKDIALVGNIYIGLSMAIPFIFGALVVSSQLNNTIIILSVLGFLSGLAREIIKSVQDMEGDKKARSSKTLPIIIGQRNSLLIAAFLYILFIPLTLAPFYFGLKINLFAISLVAIGDILFLYIVINIVRNTEPKTLKLARNLSLIALFFGLVGYLLASIS